MRLLPRGQEHDEDNFVIHYSIYNPEDTFDEEGDGGRGLGEDVLMLACALGEPPGFEIKNGYYWDKPTL
jgi:hypothetical protein